MQTIDYLQAAKRKIGAETHADVARKLGLSRAAMTKYYNGERIIDDYTAAQVAEILELDPLQVIAQANAEREKDTKRRAYWSRFAKSANMPMALAALAVVVLYMTGHSGNPFESMPLMVGYFTDYKLSSLAAIALGTMLLAWWALKEPPGAATCRREVAMT